MIGLELSLERVRILKKLVFGLRRRAVPALDAGVIGVVAWAFGSKIVASLVIGAALAMSSTAIVVPALAERKKLGTASGRATFAVLLFQDLAVTPLLVMLALLAGGDGNVDPAGALWTLAQAAIGLVAADRRGAAGAEADVPFGGAGRQA
jgi:CPA2 family monovalent cation:H+ antiporter-2